jgi:hypothetical protein
MFPHPGTPCLPPGEHRAAGSDPGRVLAILLLASLAWSAEGDVIKHGKIWPQRPTIQEDLRSVATDRMHGASVDESQVAITLLVDAAAAPGGDGSVGRPFARFADALSSATASLRRGTGVRIRLAPGVYREGNFDIASDQTPAFLSAPFIIEGAGPDRTVFSGAEVINTWTNEGGDLWSAPWQHKMGHFAGLMGQFNVKKLLGQRREMLFIDGTWQHPVVLEDYDYQVQKDAKAKPGEDPKTPDPRGRWTYLGPVQPAEVLIAGSFGVVERPENKPRLWLRGTPGFDPGKHRVEVAVRSQWGRIVFKDHVILRGIGFQHYANPFFPDEGWSREGAVQFGAPGKGGFIQLRNIIIDNCSVGWNSGGGLSLHGIERLTITNTQVNWNGCGGMSVGTCRDAVIESCSTNFNNWRGVIGDMLGWSMGGVKFHEMRDLILRNHISIGNDCAGLWWDINGENILIDGPISAANRGNGLFLEIGKGPFEVTRGIFSNPRRNLRLLCAEHITLRSNIVWVPPTIADETVRLDPDTGKLLGSMACAVDYHFYNRHSDGNMAKWDEMGHVLDGKPKTHNDFWLPGPVKASANVFAARAGAVGIHASIWLPPEIRRKELFTRAWDGSGNVWWTEPGRGMLFIDFDKPSTSAERHAFVDPSRLSERLHETDPVVSDPRFTDPDNLDFTVLAGSPLVGRSDLPLRRIDRGTVDLLRRHQAWVKTLRVGKGWPTDYRPEAKGSGAPPTKP